MSSESDYQDLLASLPEWVAENGFQQYGICDAEPGEHVDRLMEWLAQGYHGEMDYMERHADLRANPASLVPGALRIISVRMDYLPAEPKFKENLSSTDRGYISRYALGRDYHKVIRSRLRKLELRIKAWLEQNQQSGFTARVFTDSAPLLEKAYAEKAGLGWIGKNTLLLNRQAGSWFFLGEIVTNLPLPTSQIQHKNECGSCKACMTICPTGAIVAPYTLDARKCISYLTIEHRGSIAVELRALIGNRIFGCDDCQITCPWNRFANISTEADFSPRNKLDSATLLELFEWTEDEFLKKTEGSPIRRTGYQGWLRNIAVALGNAPHSELIIKALAEKRFIAGDLVAEHIDWAIARQTSHSPSSG